jgi:hypothetical protein
VRAWSGFIWLLLLGTHVMNFCIHKREIFYHPSDSQFLNDSGEGVRYEIKYVTVSKMFDPQLADRLHWLRSFVFFLGPFRKMPV